MKTWYQSSCGKFLPLPDFLNNLEKEGYTIFSVHHHPVGNWEVIYYKKFTYKEEIVELLNSYDFSRT